MANEKRLELIDRKELVKTMCRACNNECCEDPCEPGECFMYDAINNAPTVDAVPVVRCKDCKHFHHADDVLAQHCRLLGAMMGVDDFCSCGERRTDV